MSCGRRGHWGGCGPKRIVHPVKCEVKHCCTEEIVEHVHPIHTTVCNHHVIKNKHVFPHTFSQEQSVQEMNMTDPGFGMGGWGHQGHHGHHCHHGHHGHGNKCCKKRKWC